MVIQPEETQVRETETKTDEVMKSQAARVVQLARRWHAQHEASRAPGKYT